MNLIIKNELDNIVNKINNVVNAETIFLFGSFAENREKEDSDFDIYVVLDENEERPIKAIQKINFELAQMDIRSVDILANYGKVFYNSTQNPTLEKRIFEKGIKLYEREKFNIKAMA